MKKIVFLLTTAIALAVSTLAQNTPGNFFINIAGGVAIPVGEFAEKPNMDGTTGVAKTGPAAQLTVGYMLHKHWGVLFLASGSSSKRDDKAYEQAAIYPGQEIHNSVSAGSWKIGRLMLGGVYETAITNSMVFRSSLAAGLCKTSVPSLKQSQMAFINGSPVSAFTIDYAKRPLPWAFSYQLQAGLKYKLNKTWGLCADLGYVAAIVKKDSFRFNFLPTDPQWSPTATTPYVEKRQLNAINAMVSVEISF